MDLIFIYKKTANKQRKIFYFNRKNSCQSFEHFTIVNYDSRAVLTRKLSIVQH